MVTCAPIACKHKVSGSVSLPSRGSFHLSLTVLFAIGHWVVFRLGGWAPRLQIGFHVSGPTLDSPCIYSISLTGLLPSVDELSRSIQLSKPYVIGVLNPECKHSVWPLSRSLAATWKIDVSFSSYGYLDVSVPRVTFVMTMYSSCDDCTLLQPDSSIRTSAGQRIFAPYRSLSQLVTSFFGSQCQGIRPVLFLT